MMPLGPHDHVWPTGQPQGELLSNRPIANLGQAKDIGPLAAKELINRPDQYRRLRLELLLARRTAMHHAPSHKIGLEEVLDVPKGKFEVGRHSRQMAQ